MPRSPLIKLITRQAVIAGIAAGLLLVAGPAAADADQEPSNVVAFANAPVMITVAWDHRRRSRSTARCSGRGRPARSWCISRGRIRSTPSSVRCSPTSAGTAMASTSTAAPSSRRWSTTCDRARHTATSSAWRMRSTGSAARRSPPARRGSPRPSNRSTTPHFHRRRFSLGELTRLIMGLDFADATFVVRPALTSTPGAVSFESVTFPDYYIRHQNSQFWIAKNDGSSLFRQDAIFWQRKPRA